MMEQVGVTLKVHSLREEEDDLNNWSISSLLAGSVNLRVQASDRDGGVGTGAGSH